MNKQKEKRHYNTHWIKSNDSYYVIEIFSLYVRTCLVSDLGIEPFVAVRDATQRWLVLNSSTDFADMLTANLANIIEARDVA